MFALWPVSPHSSHIVVCIRGQSFRLWPFGSSVPSQLPHLCSGHAKLEALLWDMLPHSLHPCIRGQSFRLWPFGSSVPWQLVHCVEDTRRSKRFCGSWCRIRYMHIRMLSVQMLCTCCRFGIYIRCFSVDVQVRCIACNIRDSLCGWFGAIENHNECKPYKKIIALIESKS